MFSDMNKELIKILARLTALKQNIPTHSVEKKYVEEFHNILDGLENVSGENLQEFRIADSEVRPRVMSIGYDGDKHHSSESYCQREFLLMKIDGILRYFTFLLQPIDDKKPELGFHIEEKE